MVHIIPTVKQNSYFFHPWKIDFYLMAKPDSATPQVNAKFAANADWAWATTKKKIASHPNPPQLKIFLTLVVDSMPFLRKLSAKQPPSGTIIVISK